MNELICCKAEKNLKISPISKVSNKNIDQAIYEAIVFLL